MLAAAHKPANTAGALAVLLAGVTVVSLAEMLQTAASWTVTFGLCGDKDNGSLLAFFGLGMTAKDVIGPALLLGLVLRTGIPGWLGLGLCFALSGLLAEAASMRARQPKPWDVRETEEPVSTA